jgi:hypothetical protein
MRAKNKSVANRKLTERELKSIELNKEKIVQLINNGKLEYGDVITIFKVIISLEDVDSLISIANGGGYAKKFPMTMGSCRG